MRWDDGAVAGVDIVDQDLDVVVVPTAVWQWKDEDEFTERLAFPEHYWVPDEAAVRAEGQRVIKLIEAGEFPFDGTWADFRARPGVAACRPTCAAAGTGRARRPLDGAVPRRVRFVGAPAGRGLAEWAAGIRHASGAL